MRTSQCTPACWSSPHARAHRLVALSRRGLLRSLLISSSLRGSDSLHAEHAGMVYNMKACSQDRVMDQKGTVANTSWTTASWVIMIRGALTHVCKTLKHATVASETTEMDVRYLEMTKLKAYREKEHDSSDWVASGGLCATVTNVQTSSSPQNHTKCLFLWRDGCSWPEKRARRQKLNFPGLPVQSS